MIKVPEIRKLPSSKFYPKSLTLLLPMLRMIKDGLIAAEISKNINQSKSLVSYYIRKAEKLGYVSEKVRDSFKILELTQAGQNFLDQYDNQSVNHPICRLENIRFKAQIIDLPNVPVDWEKIQMHNWVQYRSVVDDIRIHLNMGEHPTLELIPSPVDGQNHYDLVIISEQDCVKVLEALEARLGMKFGRLQRSSHPEFVVYSPIAKSIAKYNGQVTVDGIGKINASKLARHGEFEFYDPVAAAEFMAMPATLNGLREEIKEIRNIMKEKKSDSSDERTEVESS
jgi:DNA-binding MarR family transcriptional regulator